MATIDFREPYNREQFQEFLYDFLPDDFVREEEEISFEGTYTREVVRLGECDSIGLSVFEVTHNSFHDARVGLSKDAFRLILNRSTKNKALVIFVPQEHPETYRFSLVSMDVHSDDGVQLRRSYSNPRRYSFLLGKDAKIYTPTQYLIRKGQVKDNEDLQNRFSVEVLTKEFYSELSDWYSWAIQEVRFPSQPKDNPDKLAEHTSQNIIRLLTRLLFVWFLKQKHLIPEEFFDEKYLSDHLLKDFHPHQQTGLFAQKSLDSIYYKAILQNLFFAMLNCPIQPQSKDDKRERGFRKKDNWGQHRDANYLMRYEELFKDPAHFLEIANRQVPFLNGGLFDCLDNKSKQPAEYVDGFSDNLPSPHVLVVPDYLFFGEEKGKGLDLSDYYGNKKKKSVNVRGLIDILKTYNFTIEENMPYDQEVSLDPELLGKVFENLLASYNPETKTTARKETGSFYTPREIVQYMVNESLIAYLKKEVDEELEQDLRKLMQYSGDEENIHLTQQQRREIVKALFNCKIIDPACGSGAYPMGILQQMVHLLTGLDADNQEWKELLLTNATNATREAFQESTEERSVLMRDIELAFDNATNRPDYARKLYLIENCIYGTDIQPIAVQISKLRFFISLVVEQKNSDDATDNFGIRPLPNLEAKFVAANSLIGIQKKEATLFDNPEIKIRENELKRVRHRLFSAKKPSTKRKLREDDKEIRSALAELLAQSDIMDFTNAQLLAEWDPYNQNTSSSFFDKEWMFGIQDGFDIVIGNPPYVQLQNNNGELAKLYEGCKYETFARTGDIYCLFYEKGWHLLKEGGFLCYITSNKWMRAAYGQKTREFFVKNTNPIQLLDFSGTKIFESATVDTNILLFAKCQNKQQTKACVTKEKDIKDLSVYFRQHHAVCSFKGSDSWVVLSPIEQSIKRKVEKVGTPLKDWEINIYRGVLTGCNDAFIISGEKKDELIAADPKSAEIIRPILRGRDIKRYKVEFADLWLIATFPSKHYNIEDYPAVKNYLLDYGYDRLKQTGDPDSRKKTNNKWFETQDNISYWDDFFKQKIVWGNLCLSAQFSLAEGGYFVNAPSTMIVPGEKYLLGILNSKLSDFYIRQLGVTRNGGYFEYKPMFVSQLPVPKSIVNIKEELETLVDKILESQIAKTSKVYESELNQLIYKFYGLDNSEIGFIESQ